MFKSVFAKYVTAVMTIFAIGFAILLFIATSIVDHYISRSKMREMESTAGALQNVVSYLAADCEPEDFESRFRSAVKDPELPISAQIAAFAGKDGDCADEDISIIESGKPKYCIKQSNGKLELRAKNSGFMFVVW